MKTRWRRQPHLVRNQPAEHGNLSANLMVIARIPSTEERGELVNPASPLEFGDDTEMPSVGPTTPGGGTRRHKFRLIRLRRDPTGKSHMGYSQREPATSPQATTKTAQREGAGLDDARQPAAARRSDFVARREVVR